MMFQKLPAKFQPNKATKKIKQISNLISHRNFKIESICNDDNECIPNPRIKLKAFSKIQLNMSKDPDASCNISHCEQPKRRVSRKERTESRKRAEMEEQNK